MKEEFRQWGKIERRSKDLELTNRVRLKSWIWPKRTVSVVSRRASMIERVEFKNFKALRDATLPLSQFTLIVGANGSGKSTALAGILCLSQRHPLDPYAIHSAGVGLQQPVLFTINWREQTNDQIVSLELKPG